MESVLISTVAAELFIAIVQGAFATVGCMQRAPGPCTSAYGEYNLVMARWVIEYITWCKISSIHSISI